MAIPKKLINYLEKCGYKYEAVSHKTTYTAWDTSQTEKIKPQEVAKSLVVKIDKDYAIIVIPANKRLDKPKSLKSINDVRKKIGKKTYKKLGLAKEAWMKKNISSKVGAIAPFGGFLKFSVYLDKLFMKNKKIYVGTGEYTSSLKISVGQYVKKEKIIIGSFSMKGKA